MFGLWILKQVQDDKKLITTDNRRATTLLPLPQNEFMVLTIQPQHTKRKRVFSTIRNYQEQISFKNSEEMVLLPAGPSIILGIGLKRGW